VDTRSQSERAIADARDHVRRAIARLDWHGDSEGLSFVLRLLRTAESTLDEAMGDDARPRELEPTAS
jgi:hypothetical protein